MTCEIGGLYALGHFGVVVREITRKLHTTPSMTQYISHYTYHVRNNTRHGIDFINRDYSRTIIQKPDLAQSTAHAS